MNFANDCRHGVCYIVGAKRLPEGELVGVLRRISQGIAFFQKEKKVKNVIVLCAMLLSIAVAPLTVQAAGGSAKSASAATQGAVNVNQATAKQLEALPGVGKVTAEQIIAYRTQKGPFASVEDLGKVKGIGPKTLEKLRPLVAVR